MYLGEGCSAPPVYIPNTSGCGGSGCAELEERIAAIEGWISNFESMFNSKRLSVFGTIENEIEFVLGYER